MTIEELIERLKALPAGAPFADVYVVIHRRDGDIHRKVEHVDYESGQVLLS